ncbi:MAG: SET domain-containing protein [Proteobacteria bacterium]|nr:SET domain-containing protein [Pseudomonadota bacterium]MBU1233616.1 SET domain-containing protein [Pseudomonadota bacterium]MBU1418907.1 SET domain-containing protein [Pseudomonadota bacterium]MBU1455669.1 SET domain-containing protein [Pseudomonadota bacterium]
MIHPKTEVRYIDEEKGYGLFATSPIASGTITWILDELDREIDPSEMARYDQKYQEILLKYSFRNNKGNYIFCWDNGRYINHSFNSNCCLTPYNFEIAVRDIMTGEEITDDYGYLNIIEPFEARAENGNRTVVYPDDLLHYAQLWDARIAAAFPRLLQLDQPLLKFLSHETLDTIQAVLQGKREMLSIRSCYYDSGSPERIKSKP